MEAHSNHSRLYLTQSKYIYHILEHLSMLESKLDWSPISVGAKLSSLDGEAFKDPHLYCCVVRSPRYLSLMRPDVTCAVNQVCQSVHHPTTSHWHVVKRILQYLKGSINFGLHI